MDLIVPMAGQDTLATQGFTTGSQVTIAGAPVISHVIEQVNNLDIDTAVFILDKDRKELRNYIRDRFDFNAVFIKQVEKKGNAHAIYGARDHLNSEDVLILFSDTYTTVDADEITDIEEDGIVFTKTVDNPTEYGVVFEHDGSVTRLVEKPDIPSSDQALIGMYYFRDKDAVFDSITHILESNIRTNGEYYLTDAIQYMIQKEKDIVKQEVDEWINLETPQNLLALNKKILSRQDEATAEENCVIIPPVNLDKSVEAVNSVIGPYVSVDKNVTIQNSRVSNAILLEGSNCEGIVLEKSLVGKYADIQSRSNKVIIGDNSEVHFS